MKINLLLIAFIVLVLISLPIAFSIGFSSMVPSFLDPSFPANPTYIIRGWIGGVDSFPILAIPLFIFSGIVMAKGGVSKKLFEVFAYFLGNKTGGMPASVILTCLFYGAISGSAPATTAAVGAMTIPLLTSLGYERVFSTAIVTVAGGLGVIIPPSIPFILYGMATGTSVGKLFIGGIFPGILIGICLIGYSTYYCITKGEDKEKLNAHYKELHDRGFWEVFKSSFWALLTPVFILGSIYSGWASPTEAATISVVYSILISMFIYKTMKLKDLPGILKESVRNYAGLLFILAVAVAFGRVLAMLQVPAIMRDAITSTFSTKYSVLIILNVILLFVGMVMDGGPAILILSPILVPIVTAIGVDPVHFGIVMVSNLAIGFVTPPMGINLFVANSMTGVPVIEIAKKAIPFIIMFLVALIFITFIPQITLFLVNL